MRGVGAAEPVRVGELVSKPNQTLFAIFLHQCKERSLCPGEYAHIPCAFQKTWPDAEQATFAEVKKPHSGGGAQLASFEAVEPKRAKKIGRADAIRYLLELCRALEPTCNNAMQDCEGWLIGAKLEPEGSRLDRLIWSSLAKDLQRPQDALCVPALKLLPESLSSFRFEQ